MAKMIEPFPLIENNEVSWIRAKAILPEDAEILSFQEFDGNICAWAIIDTEKRTVTRTFYVFQGGLFFEPTRRGKNMKFLGTCIFPSPTGKNPHAKHIFELI